MLVATLEILTIAIIHLDRLNKIVYTECPRKKGQYSGRS
jgi:hypothetical protein